MIITVASYKGGVGKTTTAIHLAAYFQRLAPTLLIDGDIIRASTKWSHRGNGKGFPFKVVDESQTAKYAREYVNGHIIIDTEAKTPPSVHWLTRRLVLAQELAADEPAAAAAGGGRAYLQALSELAIRLDDQSRLRGAARPAGVIQQFGKENCHVAIHGRIGRAQAGRGAGALAAVLIALVGIGTTALRGGRIQPRPQPRQQASPRPPCSNARRVEPWLLAQAEEGLFIVRVAELSTLPAFEPVLALLNDMAREELLQQNGVADADVPEIQLEQIEFIAGKPTVTIKAKTGVGPEGRNDEGQLMVGFESCVVRFRSPSARWQAWIAKAMPGAEKRTHKELEYVLLPQFAALGQARYLVAARDDRTLVIAGDVDGSGN